MARVGNAEFGGRVRIGCQWRIAAGHVAVCEAVAGGRLGRVHALRGLTAGPARRVARLARIAEVRR